MSTFSGEGHKSFLYFNAPKEEGLIAPPLKAFILGLGAASENRPAFIEKHPAFTCVQQVKQEKPLSTLYTLILNDLGFKQENFVYSRFFCTRSHLIISMLRRERIPYKDKWGDTQTIGPLPRAELLVVDLQTQQRTHFDFTHFGEFMCTAISSHCLSKHKNEYVFFLMAYQCTPLNEFTSPTMLLHRLDLNTLELSFIQDWSEYAHNLHCLDHVSQTEYGFFYSNNNESMIKTKAPEFVFQHPDFHYQTGLYTFCLENNHMTQLKRISDGSLPSTPYKFSPQMDKLAYYNRKRFYNHKRNSRKRKHNAILIKNINHERPYLKIKLYKSSQNNEKMDFCWSPNGKALAYLDGDKTNWQIWIYDLDAHQKQLVFSQPYSLGHSQQTVIEWFDI